MSYCKCPIFFKHYDVQIEAYCDYLFNRYNFNYNNLQYKPNVLDVIPANFLLIREENGI